jgi:hypothetical protein
VRIVSRGVKFAVCEQLAQRLLENSEIGRNGWAEIHAQQSIRRVVVAHQCRQRPAIVKRLHFDRLGQNPVQADCYRQHRLFGVQGHESPGCTQQDGSTSKDLQLRDREALAQLVAGIVVQTDKLVVRLKSDYIEDEPDRADDPSLTIPWQKLPSKRSRRILLPHNASRREVQPEQFERRARLVSAIAKGRQWLDDVVSGRVTTVQEICIREKCSVRQVNMTISLAFLAPNLVKAAVEGRLPHGIGVERLRDLPTVWSR